MRVLWMVLLLVPAASPAAPEFDAELEAWRARRIESLTREESWTSLVGLHWLDSAKTATIGSALGSDIVIGGLPTRFATIAKRGGNWTLTFAEDVEAVIDAAAAPSEATLISDQQAARTKTAPTKVRHGAIRFVLIERGERAGLRVWNAEAPGRTQFAGLDYFPADPSWRYSAAWKPHQPERTIDIATVIGTIEPMRNPGALEFERDGVAYRLEALQEEGSDQLFVIFADRTSGGETYGAGRYLYTPAPDADGRVTLDFNRAYNPPCAFSEFATCPLPPPENRLDLRVTAGELKYSGPQAH